MQIPYTKETKVTKNSVVRPLPVSTRKSACQLQSTPTASDMRFLLPRSLHIALRSLLLALTLGSLTGCSADRAGAEAGPPKTQMIQGKRVVKYIQLPPRTGSRLARQGAVLEDGTVVALDGLPVGTIDKSWVESAKGRY